jgi:hypothetical protein
MSILIAVMGCQARAPQMASRSLTTGALASAIGFRARP